MDGEIECLWKGFFDKDWIRQPQRWRRHLSIWNQTKGFSESLWKCIYSFSPKFTIDLKGKDEQMSRQAGEKTDYLIARCNLSWEILSKMLCVDNSHMERKIFSKGPEALRLWKSHCLAVSGVIQICLMSHPLPASSPSAPRSHMHLHLLPVALHPVWNPLSPLKPWLELIELIPLCFNGALSPDTSSESIRSGALLGLTNRGEPRTTIMTGPQFMVSSGRVERAEARRQAPGQLTF